MTANKPADQITSPTTRDLGTPKSVTLTIISGGIDVVAAPHTRTATLEVREVQGPPLTVTTTSSGVRIEQVKNGDGQIWGTISSFLGGGGERPKARLLLTVPDETSVSVRTASADVLAGGIHGSLTVYTVSGSVTLDRSTGPVDVTTVSGSINSASPSGELKAKTVSGDMTVQDAVLRSARLNTVSGRCILDLRHGPSLVTANSVSGAVSVRLPADCGYDATLASTSGNVVVDGETLVSEGKRGGHRYTGDRSVAIKARAVGGDLAVLRRAAAGGTTPPGPVIGDAFGGDIQDEIRRPEENR